MEVELYKTAQQKEVVEEFLDSLQPKELAKALRDLELLQTYPRELHEPYTKHIEGPIWELRSKTSSSIQRLFYFIWSGEKIVILHGFTKKPKRHHGLRSRQQRGGSRTTRAGTGQRRLKD